MAKASAADETGRTFAVGSDSDFFIFERCRYIHFDDLKVRWVGGEATRGASASRRRRLQWGRGAGRSCQAPRTRNDVGRFVCFCR